MKRTVSLWMWMAIAVCTALGQDVSTGVDANGNALNIGDIDPNWKVVSSPNLPIIDARACSFYPGYWVPAPLACTNAQWINVSGDYLNNIPGTYTFERKFVIAPNTPSFITNFRAAFDDVPLAFDLISPSGQVFPLPFTISTWYHPTQLIPREIVSPAPGIWTIRAQVNFFDSAAAFMLTGDIRLCGELLPQNLKNDLIAYYPFNGGSLLDYSPNHLDLTSSSSGPHVAGDRNGISSCAYEFTGNVGDYLTVPMATGIIPDPNTPFSISLWFKPASSDLTVYQSLFGRGTGSSCPDGMGEIELGTYDCRTPVARFNQYSSWDNTIQYPQWCGDIATKYMVNGWQHLVAVYDPNLPTGQQITMYRNGQVSSTFSGPCGNAYTDAGDIFIGKGFEGLLDDILFYKRALTAPEVCNLSSMGSSCCQYLLVSTDSPVLDQKISVFPNPAKGSIQLNLEGDLQGLPAHVELVSAFGQVIWERSFESGFAKTQIEFGQQPAGVYFVKISLGGQNHVEKLLIQ